MQYSAASPRPRSRLQCFRPVRRRRVTNQCASSGLPRLTKSYSGRRVLGFIGRRCGWCRSVPFVNAAQTGRIDALQVHFWAWSFWPFPWGTEDRVSSYHGARNVPRHHCRTTYRRELDGGQNGVIRGALAGSQRVDKGMEAVSIHQALRGADALNAGMDR